MRIGVYSPLLSPTHGGGHTYEQAVLGALLRCAAESRHRFVIFTIDPVNVNAVNVTHVPLGRALVARSHAMVICLMNRLLTSLGLPTPFRGENWIDPYLTRHQIDFVWNLNPFTITTAVPYLTVVWDLQHRLQPFFPEVSVDGRWQRWERRFGILLRRATFIICGSERGREEVERFFQVAPERIRVLPLPTPSFALEATFTDVDLPEHWNLPRRFIFYPAQFWPHKNHVTLLRALRLVRERGLDIHLALSGSDQGNLKYVESLAAELGVTSFVHFLGFVTRTELAALYGRAAALTYPSLFGPDNLPPLEAFALGCPVIAAGVPGTDEQMGDAALLVSPSDPEAWAAAIEQVLTDKSERARLVAAGHERATRSTTDDYVRAVFRILDEFEPIRKCWSASEPWRPHYLWSRLFRR